jgi:hypothetical protein
MTVGSVARLSSRTFRFALRGTGYVCLFFAISNVAFAGFPNTPEVDPGSAASALTLLVGSLLVVTDRVCRK